MDVRCRRIVVAASGAVRGSGTDGELAAVVVVEAVSVSFAPFGMDEPLGAGVAPKAPAAASFSVCDPRTEAVRSERRLPNSDGRDSVVRGSVARAGKLMPVLPKLEKRKDRNKRAKTPMPEAKMVLVGIVENERRSSKPKATRELSDVFPAAQVN